MEGATQKWRKVSAGHYLYGDTGYGVVATYDVQASDGHYERTGRMMAAATEWAAVKGMRDDDHNTGENLAWYDTMREARAHVERELSRSRH